MYELYDIYLNSTAIKNEIEMYIAFRQKYQSLNNKYIQGLLSMQSIINNEIEKINKLLINQLDNKSKPNINTSDLIKIFEESNPNDISDSEFKSAGLFLIAILKKINETSTNKTQSDVIPGTRMDYNEPFTISDTPLITLQSQKNTFHFAISGKHVGFAQFKSGLRFGLNVASYFLITIDTICGPIEFNSPFIDEQDDEGNINAIHKAILEYHAKYEF